MENSELINLLSFSHCNSREDVLEHSKKIAAELMNNWKIVSPKGERRFWGLEFYLHIPEVFEDDATHRRNEQLTSGNFYFHTKSKSHPDNPDKEKWTHPIFNRHGVDITCGDGKSIFGGILLRHLGGKGHRDGSGLALRSILRGDEGLKPIKRGSPQQGWSEDEKSILSRINNKSIFGSEIHLQHSPTKNKISIESVPRIGIEKTKYKHLLLGFKRTN